MKSDTSPSTLFDKRHAEKYDDQWSKMAAMKDALHLFTRVILTDLPNDAHILCVGVGTGAELFDLAEHNPQWKFTAVDPSAPMLELCRNRAEKKGIASRCTFHTGYVDSLTHSVKFDAATCFLVSHFLTNAGERHALFAEIGSRLLPNGILLNADISGDMASPEFEKLFSVWLQMMRYAGLPAKNIGETRESLKKFIAVVPPETLENIIKDSGFNEPTLFFQCVLVHAWYSHIGSENQVCR